MQTKRRFRCDNGHERTKVQTVTNDDAYLKGQTPLATPTNSIFNQTYK